jgi:two-component system sensor histidine kinase YesM
LESELDLIRAYVNIQNVRFDNILTLTIDISEEYNKIKIPKITLQPIVENAILHGICQKEESGTISITAQSEESNLFIRIVDDGVGMEEEVLATLLNNQQQDSPVTHGYGLSNIDNRLKYFYGSEYGLVINSEINVGTTVIIKIPLSPKGKA